MRCPKCRNMNLKTSATQRPETGSPEIKTWSGMNYTRRRRKCDACGWQEWTIELIERDIVKLLPKGTAQRSVGGKLI